MYMYSRQHFLRENKDIVLRPHRCSFSQLISVQLRFFVARAHTWDREHFCEYNHSLSSLVLLQAIVASRVSSKLL